MSRRYLGEVFDIHGGGIDLRFPHHENEQAQSHGAGWGFARHWVHNAWVTVKGEKMSKSLGNYLVVDELLTRYEPAVVRLALGTVHHRSTVEFSEEALADAAGLWERLVAAVVRARELVAGSSDGGAGAGGAAPGAAVTSEAEAAPNPLDVPSEELRRWALPAEYVEAMDEDLNLAGAMAVVHSTLKALNKELGRAGDAAARAATVRRDSDAVAGAQGAVDRTLGLALDLRAQLDVLGLDPLAEPWRDRVLEGTAAGQGSAAMNALDHLVTALLTQRAEARAAKDWVRADALRDLLAAAGVVVEDSAAGARWHLA